MAISINEAFVQQFANNVRHLAQQGDTRLRPHVQEVPLTGEAYNFDRLSATNAVRKDTASGAGGETGRRVATPFVDAPWTRRVVTPQTWQWADTIENSDKVQMLIDPESSYSVNGGMAMRRSQDDLLIEAATADAVDGGGTPVALPAAQIKGDGSTTFDLDFISEVNYQFQANDVDPDETKVFVISPIEVRQMLNDTSLTSADYMAVKALSANGMFPNFLGFTWILSNRLVETTGSPGFRSCLAFTKRGIGLAVNQDIFVRIAERPDLSHLIQVYMEWTMGATRVEDEHVVEARCSLTFV